MAQMEGHLRISMVRNLTRILIRILILLGEESRTQTTFPAGVKWERDY